MLPSILCLIQLFLPKYSIYFGSRDILFLPHFEHQNFQNDLKKKFNQLYIISCHNLMVKINGHTEKV